MNKKVVAYGAFSASLVAEFTEKCKSAPQNSPAFAQRSRNQG